jgi:hypothetical protein
VTWLPEEPNGQASEDSNYVVCPICDHLRCPPHCSRRGINTAKLFQDGNPPSDEAPPAYSTSPGGSYETPAAGLNKKSLDSSPIPQPDFSEKEKSETSAENATSVAGTIRSTVTSVIPTSTEELKAQLSEAHAQIQRLKEQLSSQGPRLHKPDGGKPGSDENVLMMQQQHPSQSADLGVPLQIVAGLCLLSFLLAYFFF